MQNNSDTTYSAAIEKVMLNNGYFAPLKILYREVWKYKDRAKVAGKTPENSIQERVQRDAKFARIGLGVYALRAHLNALPQAIVPTNAAEKTARRHAEVQGMLLEIGNFRDNVSDTYTSDRKWIFQNKTLGNLATLEALPAFTYARILQQSASFIDVIWFNDRGFPYKIFEVEHSTDFRDAFIRFMELQDFITNFYCVSSSDRQDKFIRESKKFAFKPIKSRLNFLTYAQVENDYQNTLRKTYI